MSQLVFQANAGGTITLTGTNTPSTINLTVPATNGTLLVQDTSNNLTVTNLTVTGTSILGGTAQTKIPVGNTSQRSSSPTVGMFRYNTDGGGFYEGYQAGNWVKFTTASESSYGITYLVVAGGGGSSGSGGGGGGGGFVTGNLTLIPSTVYTITVGAGGGASAGSDSLIVGYIDAIGGGRSGYGSSSSTVVGGNGGSGGGGNPGTGNPCPGGSGTSGQGNNGDRKSVV